MFKKICATLAVLGCLALALSVPKPADAGGFGNRFVCQAAWSPTALATLTTQTKTIVCPGAALGDFVDVSYNVDRLLLQSTAYVSAANTVTVLLYNSTTGTITPTITAVYASITAKYISP
jgi:hypothetical protein